VVYTSVLDCIRIPELAPVSILEHNLVWPAAIPAAHPQTASLHLLDRLLRLPASDLVLLPTLRHDVLLLNYTQGLVHCKAGSRVIRPQQAEERGRIGRDDGYSDYWR